MSNPPRESLDENQPSRIAGLLRELFEANDKFSENLAEKLTVNETDFRAMEFLIEHGPCSAKVLAKALGLSPGAVTVVIDRLEKVGHVTREPNPNDRRALVIQPKKASVDRAWEALGPIIQKHGVMLAQMSPANRDVIENYLAELLEIYGPKK